MAKATALTWSISISESHRCKSTPGSAASPTHTTRRRHADGSRPGILGPRSGQRVATSRIADVLRRYGEERHASGIARAIVRRRPIETTSELVAAIKAGMPPSARFGGGHPAKRSFQAIRIAVKRRVDSLDRALPLAWDLLKVEGRFAAISFHSLEDRPVNAFLADRAKGCICPPELPVCVCGHEPEAELLTEGRLVAERRRGGENPRQAAHLRAAVKIGTNGASA